MNRRNPKYQISPSVLEDQQIYEHLYQTQIQEQLNIRRNHRGAFIVHLVLKIIPIGIFLTDTLYNKFFSQMTMNQLLLLFVVIEFWITKNYTGRMLTGIWWGFEEVDGEQKLKVEMRVNIQVVPSLHFKLFWLLQVAYFIVPLMLVLTQLFVSSNIRIGLTRNVRAIILNSITLGGATINLALFFRAYLKMNQNHYFLKYKLGRQYIKRLGKATIVSYL